ncbi:MAG: hypothetical protein ACRDHV_08555 [Actinomycetota bacterium]
MDRVDPRLIEAALQGRETGEPALDRAALLVADLRRVLIEETPPEAAGHLEAMAVAARDEVRGSAPVLSNRRAARRRRLASMPLAAALVLGTGLAWGAGTLPEPASDRAEEAVAAAQERSDAGTEAEEVTEVTEGPKGANHGEEVSAVATDDSLQGCRKGMAVSEVAGSKGNKQGPGHDPCLKGEEGKARGQEASAKGQQTAEDARAKAQDKGEGGGGPPEGAGPPENPGSQGAESGTGNP